MSAFEIRAITSADYSSWLPLWKGYQTFYKASIPDEATEMTWQRSLDPSEPINGALAWKDGVAVGMVHWIFHRTCWTIADSCYLQDLFVDSTQRGGGIGGALIEHVYEAAKVKGCAKVHWLTHETNETAIKLYDKVGERSGFIQFRKTL